MPTTQPEPQHGTFIQSARGDGTTTPVAFLGTGRMGGPMAANLARTGFDVRVWNRTSSRAEALAADGAVMAASPAQAAGAALPLTSTLLPRRREAAAGGHADEDIAAVYLAA